METKNNWDEYKEVIDSALELNVRIWQIYQKAKRYVNSNEMSLLAIACNNAYHMIEEISECFGWEELVNE